MQQQLQLQREQDKRHQEMMQFLLTLNVGDSASRNRHSTSTTPFAQQNRQSLNLFQIPENFSSVSNHKFLSSQIPQLSGI